MFACGTGNFAHMDHDEPPPSAPSNPPSAPSTPKGSSSSKKQKQNKNPYAGRGLDKFSMVLAELETRREKIIEQAGSQGVAMVRFMCDNSQGWVPIIVRPKEAKAEAAELKKLPAPPTQPAQQSDANQEAVEKKEIKKSLLTWDMLRWRDAYYWPLVMVLILLCLVIFGRVFAICCTCIWWYMVPHLNMKERKGVIKRKEIGRRLSDKRLGGNLVVQVQGKKMGGVHAQELGSPKAHGNGKKGR